MHMVYEMCILFPPHSKLYQSNTMFKNAENGYSDKVV